MRWIRLIFTSFLFLGCISLQAFDEAEGFMGLESEIEALLEDQIQEEVEADPDFALQDYDELDEIIEEDRLDPSAQESANETVVIHNPLNEFPVNEGVATPLSLVIDEEESVVAAPILQTASPLELVQKETEESIKSIEINLKQVFSGSPIIYTLLLFLSVFSVCVWLYSMLTVRSVALLPPTMIKELRKKLVSNQFDEALDICVKEKHFFCKMLAAGILARRHGLNVMIDSMKAEGKRSTVNFWQRITLLNEIAIIAPMVGLLGTVMGMFYAFYDLNRSIESVSLLFDGLGISVGTTVAGLSVAILSMILYTIAKYRLVKILVNVENEAQTFASLIDTRSPGYGERG
ncbi:MAG: hypothetical protein KR126chlam1_01268 [Chlamydiae bacterium]|nr:hypothetical protein [Chlamydiota bacterium]